MTAGNGTLTPACLTSALDKLLADNPGPVSITAGVAALRAAGAQEPADELQSIVGTYAAERYRPIRFDRFTDSR
ncbi:hypothetical protein [Mesorhizobium sp.]|uniref:hypothetical protein n=1 Tax=Mesorhizobium sp. TaxID=1871066 RepID=UPI000FEA2D3E|nr:hypothetical protein [Mesorhizobium sp.]RWE78784.1 MAG: hypothetical protein EOS42_04165 [Mesorhizobium sp.]